MCQAASCSGCAGWGVPGGFVLMLAGECPLFSAWGRFEDGAPATHVRCAASYTVPLQTQLVQIAVRHRLHLI